MRRRGAERRYARRTSPARSSPCSPAIIQLRNLQLNQAFSMISATYFPQANSVPNLGRVILFPVAWTLGPEEA
jgi:hypothetical protein